MNKEMMDELIKAFEDLVSKIEEAKKLIDDHSNTLADSARLLRISRTMLYRNLNGQADK